MIPSLPEAVLALPATRISLQPLSIDARNKVSDEVRRGKIRTVRELFQALSPNEALPLVPGAEALARIAVPLPEGIDDLLSIATADLWRSVDMAPEGSPAVWYTVRDVLSLSGAHLRLQDRARVLDALALRSERRRRAREAERAREASRTTEPPEPFVQAWTQLRDLRARLRAGVVPEGEYEVLSELRILDDPPAVRLSSADGTEVARVLLPVGPAVAQIEIRRHHGWAVAAIDRILELIADPTASDHDALRTLLFGSGWDRDLRRLDTLLGAVSTEPLVVGWRVTDRGGISFRPVRCTPKKRGGGYTVKNVAWREVGDGLPGVDGRIVRLLHRWSSVAPELASLAAKELVGHPRVFGPGAGGPIRVRAVDLVLAFVREEGGVRPSVEIAGEAISVRELAGHLRGPATGTWLRLLPHELQVVSIRPDAARILVGWLERAGVVADDGVGELLARLPALTSLVPVRLDPVLRGAEVEGDPRPVLRVTWDGATLGLDVRVRPLPELPPILPGEGLAELVALRRGVPCFVRRDLAAEPDRVLASLAPLGLTAAERDGWRWVVTDPSRAVDVLLGIAEAGGAFRTEWDGPTPTAQRVSGGNVRVRVGTGRDWFDVSGQVEVDGASVELRELLAAARDGRSFLQVRPDLFVRIAEELRGALRAVAVAEDDGRIASLHTPVLEDLAEAGAEVEGSEEFRASVERIRAAADHVAQVPEGLELVLRDYQVEGFRWLARLATWAPGAILADDMGLGKTVQAIGLLRHREGPALVVCPLSVIANWEAELARFGPELGRVTYRGAGRARHLEGLGPRTVVLASWDLLARDAALSEVSWGTVVLDEAQAVKNAGTARSKGARGLRAGFLVALTGTPVENRSEELWSLFRVVAPGLLGSAERFVERFAGPISRGEAGARDVLARVVRPFVLRRTKSEVAPELPSRTEVVVRVPLSPAERALYDAARLEAVARTTAVESHRQRFEILRWLTRLRQLACNPKLVDPGSPIASSKLEQLRHRIADLRETGHQALVFSQFVSHLGLVREALEADGAKVRWITGDVEESERRREVAAFQAGDGDVFLISLGAGGTGLNLTAATYVFHLDPWWNPAKEDQASDRAHRIGQTRPVTIYRLVAEGTIEEQILALHEEKRDLADALLSGADGAARADTEELLALLSDAVGEGIPPEVIAELAADRALHRPPEDDRSS